MAGGNGTPVVMRKEGSKIKASARCPFRCSGGMADHSRKGKLMPLLPSLREMLLDAAILYTDDSPSSDIPKWDRLWNQYLGGNVKNVCLLEVLKEFGMEKRKGMKFSALCVRRKDCYESVNWKKKIFLKK